MKTKPAAFALCVLCALCVESSAVGPGEGESGGQGRDERPWTRHAVDTSSRGADGVKLMDVNGDKLPDIVTGWEEGGLVRVYLNPGPAKVRDNWPAVTVGKVGNLEDAVFADLDGDGNVDVISAAEGGTKRISIHWAPKDPADYLKADKWTTAALPASLGKQWMFIEPAQLDGKCGLDFVAGAKNAGASIGWFQAPPDPRDANAWTYHKLRDAGWIMSIFMTDMNADGKPDILFSDRKGKRTGAFWMENPGPGEALTKPWPEHPIGGLGKECMFLQRADLDGDGRADIVMPVKSKDILFLRSLDDKGLSWDSTTIAMPATCGRAKGIGVGDIDLNGKADLVFSCESATPPLSGVMRMGREGPAEAAKWKAHDISGPEGVKYDLVVLIDLDHDGDLDVLTCEEARNLGVIWYENPKISSAGNGQDGRNGPNGQR